MAYKLPSYISDYNFKSSELRKLIDEGIVENKVDDYGNVILKPELPSQKDHAVSNQLMILERYNTEVSSDLIEQYYDTSFSEFTDVTDVDDENSQFQESNEISEEVDEQLKREQILNTQVEELVNALEKETQRNIKFQEDAESNYNAPKNLLIQMRIENGEGNDPSDFNDAFPFLPKNNTNEPIPENSPYVVPTES